MKVLLKSDGKTVLFLSDSATLNANDEMWQMLDVACETPLIDGRESLWVVFQNVAEPTLLSNESMLERCEDGHYRILFPDGVIAVPGEWTFQLFMRTYDTVNEKWANRIASDLCDFTVSDGLPISGEDKVTKTTIADLHAEAVQKIQAESKNAENITALDGRIMTAEGNIDTLERGLSQTSQNVQTNTDAIQSLEDEKGQPNGVATLGADGKVPSDQLPAGQGGFDVNIENGTGKSSVQQLPDGVKDGFDFTGKNPNATALDDTLTGIIPYGATGDFASSFGGKSAAMGKRSHAEGTTTIAKGKYSHAEGDNSVALGDDSHAEGNTTVSKGNGSHSEGRLTIASGDFSHAEGLENNADAYSTHAEGVKTQAMAEGSHTEGYATVTHANFSHAEGTYSQTGAGAEGAHAEGYRTTASGFASHAEGGNTTASGSCAHSEGNSTTASGSYSHAGGCNTIASGDYSYAEGNKTQATGGHSHAAGYDTIASGDCAYADGNSTQASGNHSHASGYKTKATVAEQYVVGRWNKENDNALLIVGSGTSEKDRKNSFEVLFDGRAKAYGEPKEPEDVVRLKELRAMGGGGTKLYRHKYTSDAMTTVYIVTTRSTAYTQVADIAGDFTQCKIIKAFDTSVGYSATFIRTNIQSNSAHLECENTAGYGLHLNNSSVEIEEL